MDVVDVKEHLIQTDEGFRKLAEQHEEYERQLKVMLHRPYLSERDQLQETVIKKKKLAVKDQMQTLIHRYQLERSAS